jgi:hypothetical protein
MIQVNLKGSGCAPDLDKKLNRSPLLIADLVRFSKDPVRYQVPVFRAFLPCPRCQYAEPALSAISYYGQTSSTAGHSPQLIDLVRSELGILRIKLTLRSDNCAPITGATLPVTFDRLGSGSLSCPHLGKR